LRILSGRQIKVKTTKKSLQQVAEFFVVIDKQNLRHTSQFFLARNILIRAAALSSVGADFKHNPL